MNKTYDELRIAANQDVEGREYWLRKMGGEFSTSGFMATEPAGRGV